MKIKLTKPAGFLSSAKHIIIEADSVETIVDSGDTREVTLINGNRFSVSESIDAIDKLMNPPTATTTPAKTEQA